MSSSLSSESDTASTVAKPQGTHTSILAALQSHHLLTDTQRIHTSIHMLLRAHTHIYNHTHRVGCTHKGGCTGIHTIDRDRKGTHQRANPTTELRREKAGVPELPAFLSDRCGCALHSPSILSGAHKDRGML